MRHSCVSGLCPAPLLKISNSMQLGGVLQLNETNDEECKKYCITNENCISVDYNKYDFIQTFCIEVKCKYIVHSVIN